MRDLPIALTFDLDSDLFDESVAPTDGHTKVSWRGLTEGIGLIRERLSALSASHKVRTCSTWFVRVDNQIADLYGRPAHLLEEHRALFETLIDEGDEIGWHPHLYRLENGGWRQETDDAVLARNMAASLTDMKAVGFTPSCGRIGEAYGSNGIMAAFDELNIGFDSTAMPGRRRVDEHRMLDWSDTPASAYRPSIADYRIPGDPARSVIEIPMSMLKVKAAYDAEPFLRYLDLSYRNTALAVGIDDLVREAPYIVAVTHPSALLKAFEPEGGHGLVTFDPDAITQNLTMVIQRARALGRQPRFLRLADLGAELESPLK